MEKCIMANCPHCNYKLSLVDLKTECPVCGVNIPYYNMDEVLKKEADKAEYEHAMTQPKFDRLKAATIGSTVSKVRIGICLLPLLATLLPLGKEVITLPYAVKSVTVNAISIVNAFSNLDTGFLFSMMGYDKVGTAYIGYFVGLIGIALAAVAALLNLIFLIMSCGKKGIQRNVGTAIAGIVATVIAGVGFIIYTSTMKSVAPDIFSGSIGWGGLGILAAFAAEIAINLIYKKKGIQVKYTDVSQYLIAYDDRVKTDGEESEEVTVAVETAEVSE